MRCGEIMRRAVSSIAETDDVATAARRMRDDDVGFLPVVNRDGVAVGVVTDRDLALRATAREPGTTLRVADVMTRDVVSCHAEQLVARAEALMRARRLTRIVVVDDGGRPQGVLSLSDLSQYEPAATIGRLVRDVATRKYSPERP